MSTNKHFSFAIFIMCCQASAWMFLHVSACLCICVRACVCALVCQWWGLRLWSGAILHCFSTLFPECRSLRQIQSSPLWLVSLTSLAGESLSVCFLGLELCLSHQVHQGRNFSYCFIFCIFCGLLGIWTPVILLTLQALLSLLLSS